MSSATEGSSIVQPHVCWANPEPGTTSAERPSRCLRRTQQPGATPGGRRTIPASASDSAPSVPSGPSPGLPERASNGREVCSLGHRAVVQLTVSEATAPNPSATASRMAGSNLCTLRKICRPVERMKRLCRDHRARRTAVRHGDHAEAKRGTEHQGQTELTGMAGQAHQADRRDPGRRQDHPGVRHQKLAPGTTADHRPPGRRPSAWPPGRPLDQPTRLVVFEALSTYS